MEGELLAGGGVEVADTTIIDVVVARDVDVAVQVRERDAAEASQILAVVGIAQLAGAAVGLEPHLGGVVLVADGHWWEGRYAVVILDKKQRSENYELIIALMFSLITAVMRTASGSTDWNHWAKAGFPTRGWP